MKNIFSKISLLYVLLGICMLDLSCKKNEEIDVPSQLKDITIENVKSENTGQWSFKVSYTIKGTVEVSGISFLADSLALVTSNGQELAGVPNGNNSYSSSGDFTASPRSYKVYFKIFIQDANGYRSYSKVYSHNLASLALRNPYIVHGLGQTNTHLSNSFWDYDEGPYGWMDNSLCVMSALNDVTAESYGAVLAGVKLSKATVVPGNKNEIRHKVIFDVPQAIPFGKAKLELSYKGELVSTEQVEVIAGGLISQQTRSIPKEMKGNYIFYGNEMFNYASNGSDSSTDQYFYKWNPSTNIWTKLTNPPSIVPTWSGGNGMQVVNGIIYLMPQITVDKWGFAIEEYLVSYNIASGQWRKKVLSNGSSSLRLVVHDSFVYKGKIYWIGEGSGGRSDSQTIMSYDPVTETYERFIDYLSFGYSVGYRAAILGDQVYLLRSSTRSSYGSTYTNANEFFELNMDTKKLIAKPWFTDKSSRQWIAMNGGAGFLTPYLVSHKGKIYAYGGSVASSYNNRHSTLFVVYDPATEKWEPVGGYSPYIARVSQTDGFMLSMGEKLYLGHGVNGYYSSYSSSLSKTDIHSNIYSLSVK